MTDIRIKTPSFVVAFNRDRDSYQVPLALAEAGWLQTLVTDFYASDRDSRIFKKLAHRRIDGLPPSLTDRDIRVLLMQILGLKVLNKPNLTYNVIDRMLGARARAVARRTQADLLLYSQYALEAFSDPKLMDRRRVLFSFHPHRLLIRDLLKADSETFPDLAWTIREGEPSPRSEEREDRELGLAQFVLCASSFTMKSIRYAGFNDVPVSVVPYGAPAPLLASPIERAETGCRFLFVGQGVQRKGLHHLLAAWKRLSLPGATLTVVCYRIDPALMRLVDDRVDLRSGVSRAELESLFATSHVFVMPSLIEGFGLVFLEAMAHGCYVIGSENTGLPDLELPPSAASVVRAGDIDGLARAMESAYLKQQAEGLPHDEIRNFAARTSWNAFRENLRATLTDRIGTSQD